MLQFSQFKERIRFVLVLLPQGHLLLLSLSKDSKGVIVVNGKSFPKLAIEGVPENSPPVSPIQVNPFKSFVVEFSLEFRVISLGNFDHLVQRKDDSLEPSCLLENIEEPVESVLFKRDLL